MQHCAGFITADFLYMFRASCPHHQEYKILTRQPPVLVVMVAGGSSLHHIRNETDSFVPNMVKWGSTRNHNYLYRWLPCQYVILFMMGAWHPKHVEKICSNKTCILLHHVGVLFNLTLSSYCLVSWILNFCVITPCNHKGGYRDFGGFCFIHLLVCRPSALTAVVRVVSCFPPFRTARADTLPSVIISTPLPCHYPASSNVHVLTWTLHSIWIVLGRP